MASHPNWPAESDRRRFSTCSTWSMFAGSSGRADRALSSSRCESAS